MPEDISGNINVNFNVQDLGLGLGGTPTRGGLGAAARRENPLLNQQQQEQLATLREQRRFQKEAIELQTLQAGEQQEEKKSFSIMSKGIGWLAGGLGIGLLIKQSKVASAVLGSISQMLGALVDVILAPLIPLLLPVLKGLAALIGWVQRFMVDPKAAMIEAWNFFKDQASKAWILFVEEVKKVWAWWKEQDWVGATRKAAEQLVLVVGRGMINIGNEILYALGLKRRPAPEGMPSLSPEVIRSQMQADAFAAGRESVFKDYQIDLLFKAVERAKIPGMGARIPEEFQMRDGRLYTPPTESFFVALAKDIAKSYIGALLAPQIVTNIIVERITGSDEETIRNAAREGTRHGLEYYYHEGLR